MPQVATFEYSAVGATPVIKLHHQTKLFCPMHGWVTYHYLVLLRQPEVWFLSVPYAPLRLPLHSQSSALRLPFRVSQTGPRLERRYFYASPYYTARLY